MTPSDNSKQRLEGRAELRDAAIALMGEATRELCIASQELEPALFLDAALIEALKQHLLQQRRLKVRLLLSDGRAARRHGDRLIELMRRLPSQFLVHEPLKVDLAFEHELWIADTRSYLKRESNRALYATWAQQQPLETKIMRDDFEQAWQQSTPSIEFRQL